MHHPLPAWTGCCGADPPAQLPSVVTPVVDRGESVLFDSRQRGQPRNDYAALQRKRESVGEVLHCIRVPALVRPYAKCGLQNAPGCTPLYVGWVGGGGGGAFRVVVFGCGGGAGTVVRVVGGGAGVVGRAATGVAVGVLAVVATLVVGAGAGAGPSPLRVRSGPHPLRASVAAPTITAFFHITAGSVLALQCQSPYVPCPKRRA